jgi:hypothetical protein
MIGQTAIQEFYKTIGKIQYLIINSEPEQDGLTDENRNLNVFL